MKLDEHPTVKAYRERPKPQTPSGPLQADRLRKLCMDAGADDVGFVEIDRPAMGEQKEELLAVFPPTRTVVGLAYRLNRAPLQTVAHSVANVEFKHGWEQANRTARRIVSALEREGVPALNCPAGFPYEAERWPGQMWFTSDKIVAIEAGLGQMGWNRLVIHPTFGDSVLLGTLLVGATVDSYSTPLDYNPCIECKLCVSVCPVGAVATDGNFDFFSCYTNNYRERLGGFSDWIRQLVESKNHRDYRKRVSDSETISMWQNISIGAQTRCDKCMAICPAGKEVIGPFLEDRKGFTEHVFKRLRDKEETVYVVKGSDAEAYVTKRFPNKKVKRVSNGIRPSSAEVFLRAMPLIFQREQSDGLDATFHFTFTGKEDCKGTAVIRNKTLEVQEGLVGAPDLHLIADAQTWVDFLSKEKSLPVALLTRKIKVKGSPSLMMAFARCFPS